MGRGRGAAATLTMLLFGSMCSFRFDKAWNLYSYCSTKKRRFARWQVTAGNASNKCCEWTVIFCFEARKGIFACNNWRRKAELSHDAPCAQGQDWQRFDVVAAANDNMKALFGKFTETGGSQTMCLESCLCSPSRLKHPNKAKKCYCPWSQCRWEVNLS